jgi:L-aminopeptidase/D-esterase-like protein
VTLTARTEFDGPALEFDFPSFRVGIAEYDEGPTGCTVFHFLERAACATDVRGASAATIGGYELVDAICLAGGSAYGLEAATGVAAGLFAARGYSRAWTDIALVSGAILFDFGRRESAVYPDKTLGLVAFEHARPGVFPLGARGAGRSATVGKAIAYEQGEPSGQGGAFMQAGPTKLAVFTAVNALGAVVDRDGRVVRGNLDPDRGERRGYLDALRERLDEGEPPAPEPGSTTLTVVVTNQQLPMRELRQLGRQVHGSMARAIQPFNAIFDGDVLYAVTTGEVENPALDVTALGALGSELAWDAVLAAVR